MKHEKTEEPRFFNPDAPKTAAQAAAARAARRRELKRERNSEKPRAARLRWVLTIFVFLALLSSDLICLAGILILFFTDMLVLNRAPLVWGLLMLLSSSLLGGFLYVLYTTHFLKPLEEMVTVTERVRNGDFSSRVKLPEHSLAAKSEIGVLAESFNNMTTELAGTELFRKDFISNFSHEFKTPIISIRGFARQLASPGLSEEQRQEYAGIIVEEAEMLAGMSSNVLLLTKLEHQEIVSEKTEFSLDEQLRRCMLMFEEQWTRLELNIDMELEEITCYSNEEMLTCVWTNLISNAIKFSKPGGALYIGCHAGEDCVTVTVRDSGIGMDKETQRHIFEKFYQGDTSHAGKGNGLGLSLVERIMTLLDGTITLDSAPGFGSTFVVTLPL